MTAKTQRRTNKRRARPTDGARRGPRRPRRRPRQTEMVFPVGHGGARRGAGRKRVRERAGVPHRRRERLRKRLPVHVTLRMLREVGRLRRRRVHQVLRKALLGALGQFGVNVVHYSVQSNHIHLLVEVGSSASLARAMKGLGVRITRGLNRMFHALGWPRTGTVFEDRYHARVLETIRECHNALKYVLLNYRRHAWQGGRTLTPRWLDPFSSAVFFDDWAVRPVGMREAEDEHRDEDGELQRVTGPPRTWLLRVGRPREGPIDPSAIPGR